MTSHVPAQPFNVNDTENATFAAVPAVTGKDLDIRHLVISLDTADNITIKAGDTTVFGPIYLAAKSGHDFVIHPNRLKLPAGSALNITKGTATTPVTAFGFMIEE